MKRAKKQSRGVTKGDWQQATRIVLIFCALLAIAVSICIYAFPVTCDHPTPFNTAITAPVATQLIEQYKAYISDLGAYGSELAAAQTFYMTLIAALISVLAVKEKLRPVDDYARPVSIFVFFLIAIVCCFWCVTSYSYKNVFAAKFSVLAKMEGAIHGLYPMYTEQRHHVCAAGPLIGATYTQMALVAIIGFAALVFAVRGIIVYRRQPEFLQA